MSENKHKTYQELIEEHEVDFTSHNVWLQRNNHYGGPEWELLAFEGDKFINTNGEPCYISIGFRSNKLDEEDYKVLFDMKQDSIRLSHFKSIYHEKLYPDLGEKRPLYRPLSV